MAFAAVNVASSSGVMPPSGPTTSTMSPPAGRSTVDRPAVASSCSTNAAAAASIRCATRAVDSSGSPATSGSHGRRACLAASRAVATHFSRARSPRASRQRATDRVAAQGTISSTPTSVIACTASSPRSPLAIPCTTTSRGSLGGACPRPVTVTSRAPRRTAVTVASAVPPRPSPSTSVLPHAEPLHVGGVVPLRPVERVRASAGGQRGDQKQRAGHAHHASEVDPPGGGRR